jgi:hypothetical protein
MTLYVVVMERPIPMLAKQNAVEFWSTTLENVNKAGT